MALNFPTYPAWVSNERSNWDQEDSAAQVAFQSSFNRAADEKSDMNMLKFRQQMAHEDQQRQGALIAERLTPVANALSGAQSPAQAWEIVSKNPQWMADPIQGQFVDKVLQTQTDIAKAQVASLQGQMNTADTTDFMKRLATIDATDRASIRAMSPNKDGSISAMQWQALGMAEERSKVHAENQRRMAEIDALARGDQPTTTVSEKGVETVYKPRSVSAATSETPKTMDIDGGAKLVWMPGSKAIHVINPSGKKFEFTPSQLQDLAGGMRRSDPRKAQIDEFLADKALQQIGSPSRISATNSQATPTVPKDPLGLFK